MDNFGATFVRLAIFGMTLYLTYVELQQVFFLRTEYLFDPYNILQPASLILNLIIVIQHSSAHKDTLDDVHLIHMTSVASILLWFLLFYWMRLFRQTGFYVDLII